MNKLLSKGEIRSSRDIITDANLSVKDTREWFCAVVHEIVGGIIDDNDFEKKLRNNIIYDIYASSIGGQQVIKHFITFRTDNSTYEIIKEGNNIALKSIDWKERQRFILHSTVFDIAEMFKNIGVHPMTYKKIVELRNRKQKEEEEAEAARLKESTRIKPLEERIANVDSGKKVSTVGLSELEKFCNQEGITLGICDNPGGFIYKTEHASLYYKTREGGEILLIAEDNPQPTAEEDRKTHLFIVEKSKNNAGFLSKKNTFKEANRDEFYKKLKEQTKYPDELLGSTVGDFENIEVVLLKMMNEQDVDLKPDEGLIPYELLAAKRTAEILDYVSETRKPIFEIRKMLDYEAETGLITKEYKASIYALIKMRTEGKILYDFIINSKGNEKRIIDFAQKYNEDREQKIDIENIIDGLGKNMIGSVNKIELLNTLKEIFQRDTLHEKVVPVKLIPDDIRKQGNNAITKYIVGIIKSRLNMEDRTVDAITEILYEFSDEVDMELLGKMLDRVQHLKAQKEEEEARKIIEEEARKK